MDHTLAVMQLEGAPRSAEQLQAAAERWLVEGGIVVDVAADLAALQAEGWVVCGPGGWSLTEGGAAQAEQARKRLTREGFDRVLLALSRSPVYAEHCRRVYGVDRFQFDMVDHVQAQLLLQRCGLQPGDRFVDLGCALGSLTGWLARQTGAHGLGIDFAPGVIAQAALQAADEPLLSFTTGDLDALALPDSTFDVALAVDTLYFAADLQHTLRDVFRCLAPGGRLIALYTASRRQDEPEDAISPGGCRLGIALAAVGARLDAAHELTDEGRGVWERSLEALAALRDRWEEEDALRSWIARDEETRRVLARYREGCARRWMLIASR